MEKIGRGWVDGFKQSCISDGHLADVLILSTQEPVQLAALQIYTIHRLLWWKSTNVIPHVQILPRSKDNKRAFRKSNQLSGRPQRAQIEGRVKKPISATSFLSVAEACGGINTKTSWESTQPPIKIHLQLLSNWASVSWLRKLTTSQGHIIGPVCCRKELNKSVLCLRLTPSQLNPLEQIIVLEGKSAATVGLWFKTVAAVSLRRGSLNTASSRFHQTSDQKSDSACVYWQLWELFWKSFIDFSLQISGWEGIQHKINCIFVSKAVHKKEQTVCLR